MKQVNNSLSRRAENLTFLLDLLSTSEVMSSEVLYERLNVDGLDKHDNHVVFLL